MEFSTSDVVLKSNEIKPRSEFYRYVQLLSEEYNRIQMCEELKRCYACTSTHLSKAGVKLGVEYVQCDDCLSFFAKKRPHANVLIDFIKNSQAKKYWNNEILKFSKEKRVEKVVIPTIDWINNFIPLSKDGRVVELGPTSCLLHDQLNGNTFAINPACEGFKNLDRILTADTSKKFQAMIISSQLDWSDNPESLLTWAHDHLDEQGYCFITTILSTGVDTLLLGIKSETILAPDRLNCLSFEGVEKIADRIGFNVVEISTPGSLDLEYIRENLHEIIGQAGHNLFDYILNKRRDECLHSDLISFLQAHRLSSRARIVLQKKK